MLKKSLIIFFITFFALAALESQEAKPRVAVSAPVNRIGEIQYDIVSNAVMKTVLLTLQVMGKYEVIEIMQEESSNPDLLAAEKDIDTIITGEILEHSGSACIIRLSVYDKQKKAVVLVKEEKPETILDIFDASDSITISLLEAFSGVHIAYGRLAIESASGSGLYQVFLNDLPAGWSSNPLPRILAGTYKVDIVQSRPLDTLSLYSGTVEINENRTTRITVDFPQITEKEAAEFSAIDRFILANWFEHDKKVEIEAKLASGLSMAANPSSSFLRQLETKYEKYREMYRLETIFSSGSSGGNFNAQKTVIRDDNKPGFGRLIDKTMLPSGYQSESISGIQPGPAAQLFSIRKSTAEKLEGKGVIPEIKSGEIVIDGKEADWVSIPPLLTDETGDTSGGGGDIKAIKIARDDKYLYMNIISGEKRLISFNGLWFQLYFSTPTGNLNFHCDYYNNQWHSSIYRWENIKRTSTLLSAGTVRVSGNAIECRFLLADVYKHFERNFPYFASAQSAQSGSSNRIDRVMQPKQIFF